MHNILLTIIKLKKSVDSFNFFLILFSVTFWLIPKSSEIIYTIYIV